MNRRVAQVEIGKIERFEMRIESNYILLKTEN